MTIGIWLAARRLHQGHFVWQSQDKFELSLSCTRFHSQLDGAAPVFVILDS